MDLLVFCYQNCSVRKKCSSDREILFEIRGLKVKNLQNCLDHQNNLFKQWKVRTIFGKVRTFWEALKIWKNLPYGFDKSADLLSNCQNYEEDFFQNLCAFKKFRILKEWFVACFLMFPKSNELEQFQIWKNIAI